MNSKVLLIVLGVILLSFSLLVGGSFPYLLLFILTIILIYSYISIKNVEKKLIGVFWCDAKTITKGDEINLNYKLYNSSVLPIPYGEINMNMPSGLSLKDDRKKVFFIRPFEDLNINNLLKCDHRGVYEIGEMKVTVGDIFDINKGEILVKDSVPIVVYPKIYKISQFNLEAKESFGYKRSNQKLNEDYSSLKDIRKYQSGDSVKRIDWKTTSKRGELFVKHYDISVHLQVKIFMDFQLSKYERDNEGFIEEKVVECVISIINHTLLNKIKIDLITYGDKKIELSARDISRINDFLEILTRVKPKKDISLGEVILNESRGFSPGMTILVVTPKIDNRLLTSLITLKNSGYVVIVITVGVLGVERKSDNNMIMLEKSGIKLYKIDINDNLTYVLR